MCFAQNYHGIEGSPYAGGLGAANNPASILSAPYPWDITIFSLQEKNSSNAVTLHNLSFLHFTDTVSYQWKPGYMRRFANFDYNIHLLNVRINLDKENAIAFGGNLRGYGNVRTGPANYNDSLKDMNQFFAINPFTNYDAKMTSSSWLELFFTYSRTLIDDNVRRLNAGVTLKGMRGASGLFAQLSGGGIDRSVSGTQTNYFLKAGDARYGYSGNYDRWKNSNSTTQNLKDLFGAGRPGAALDLGLEYWIKRQAVIPNAEKAEAWYDYEWKIGVSLLDIGQNNYRYGTQSRTASNPRSDISDSALNAKFGNPKSLADFNDSLATIVNNISTLNGQFRIWNPTRLVINVDRPLRDNFSVNANLVLNMPWTSDAKRLVVKDMTLLTLTPRWETKKWGLYMPLQVTTDGKFWVGGAAKAGPVLFGIHNMLTVISKSRAANAGLYLALVIRPGSGPKEKVDRRLDCPPN